MGIYINPPDMSKEEWLSKHGIKVPTAHLTEATFGSWKDPQDRPCLPVCLVDNGIFTAAGIAFSPNDLDAFLHPDGRPRKWYLAAIDDLVTVGALQPEYAENLKHGFKLPHEG